MTEEGSERSNNKGKKQKATIKEQIIALKLFNPRLSPAEIAKQLTTTVAYVYKVWSIFVRKQVKISRRAKDGSLQEPVLPVHVHGWFYYNQVPRGWYRRCPYRVVDNRNRMKLARTRLYTFCIYPSGSIFVYPFFKELTEWKDLLRDRISYWLNDNEVQLFMDTLHVLGRKEFAFKTTGVPLNLNIRVKGLGSFKTETTPYPDGTTEFTVDPGFDKRINNLESNLRLLVQVTRNQANTLGTFKTSMNEHLALIRELRETTKGMKEAVDILKEKKRKGLIRRFFEWLF